MDFNNEEFGNVSDRLERYATQVGALQAKLEYQEKMSEQERKLDVMGMELDRSKQELTATQMALAESERGRLEAEAERDMWRKKCEEAEAYMNSAAVENAFLKNCILLSVTSIKDFFHILKRVEMKALAYTFLMKTLSPIMGSKGIEVVNEATEFSDVSELSKLADQLIMSNEGIIKHD